MNTDTNAPRRFRRYCLAVVAVVLASVGIGEGLARANAVNSGWKFWLGNYYWDACINAKVDQELPSGNMWFEVDLVTVWGNCSTPITNASNVKKGIAYGYTNIGGFFYPCNNTGWYTDPSSNAYMAMSGILCAGMTSAGYKNYVQGQVWDNGTWFSLEAWSPQWP
jgi:hypothetical protein